MGVRKREKAEQMKEAKKRSMKTDKGKKHAVKMSTYSKQKQITSSGKRKRSGARIKRREL